MGVSRSRQQHPPHDEKEHGGDHQKRAVDPAIRVDDGEQHDGDNEQERGAEAEQVERLVLEPLEDQLAEVGELDRIQSTAFAETAVVELQLRDTTTDVDEAWDDVSCGRGCDPTEGQPIEVIAGQEVAGIDFQLQPL